MTSRLLCCVPFCRRTAKYEVTDGEVDPDQQMICRNHGMLASKRTRSIWKRLYKKADRLMQKDPDLCSSGEIALTLRMVKLERRAWTRFKAECIEKAGGLQ